MKLIVITPSDNIPNEQAIVTKLFENGLTTLHLRKPKQSTLDVMNYLNEIPKNFHNRIVIHSHHKLALKYNLKGIHLSKVHLSKKLRYWLVRIRLKMNYKEISKSRSYNNLKQINESESQSFSYYLTGTMFNNMTGELYGSFHEKGIVEALKKTNKNIIARGGTSLKSIPLVKKYGFYGVSFSSFIWQSKQPINTFIKILETFEVHKLEIE